MGKKETLNSNIPVVKEPTLTFSDSFFTDKSEFIGNKQNVDFGESQQYDTNVPVSMVESGDYKYLRGERQTNWDKLGNGLVNMGGKIFTTATEGIVNPFYGTIAALTNTNANGDWDPSMNAYYNNALNQSLDNFGKAVEENFPTYETKAEATATGLDKLWSFNTLSRDILGGAGTSIGAALTGAAWSKGFSLLGKAMGAAGSAEEAAAILAEAKQSGIAASADKLKYISDQALKKDIRDGLKQGTINLMGAQGEAGAESREAEKTVLYKLTHDDFGNEKPMTESELEYAKMMARQAGDAAFALNVPVISFDNYLSFGKTLFGNKTNDFAKIAKKGTVLDEATGAYKVAEKGKYANLGYRASKFGTPLLSEGTQEQLQFAIGKTVEDYYTKKYYNPNVADFTESMTKGLAEAYGTEEGWHSGIIGALSAGIASPGMVLAGKGVQAFKDEYITNPDDAIAAKAVESLNKYTTDVIRKKFVDNAVRSSNLTEDKDEALTNNDDFNYHNANEDLIFGYVYNRMQNGKLDDVKKELDAFKDLTVEELKTNYGIDVNVENKSKVDELTSKNAVRNFVESRLEKIAAIEDTYNSVTKLFPNANPEVQELLMYSAQGINNAKKRKSELADNIGSKLPKLNLTESITAVNNDPNAVLASLSFNPQAFKDSYNNLTPERKELFKKQVEESNDINPMDKDIILGNLKDLESLNKRESDFVLAYNALKNPQLQNQFLQKSEDLWAKYADIAKQKEQIDAQEQVAPVVETPVEQPTEVVTTPEVVTSTTTTTPETKSPWFDANTTPEELTNKLTQAIDQGQITEEQAGNIFNDFATQSQPKPVQTTETQTAETSPLSAEEAFEAMSEGKPVEEVTGKDTEVQSSVTPYQNVLMTRPENRDTAVQKNGKVIGEIRQDYNLTPFSKIQEILKYYFDNNVSLKEAIEFTEDGNHVMLNLIGPDGILYPVSIIQHSSEGLTENKDLFDRVINVFYDENSKPKDINSINALLFNDVLDLNQTRYLNLTASGEVGITADKVIESAPKDSKIELFYGDSKINIEEEFTIEDDEEVKSVKNEDSEDIVEIQKGMHLKVVLADGVEKTVKARNAEHSNPQEVFGNTVSRIQTLLQELETTPANEQTVVHNKIKEVVDEFNNEIFFALKPEKGQQRVLTLNYNSKDKKLYLKLQTREKGTKGFKSVDILQKGTKNKIGATIKIEDLTVDNVIKALNASDINSPEGTFTKRDIKFNKFVDENNKLQLDRIETPIGEEGLLKYGIQIGIGEGVIPASQPVESVKEPVSTTTTTDLEAKKADIEKRRQEELISLLPQNKISKGSLDFSAAFSIGIPEFYQQMFDMVKEGKDTIAGVKEKNAPLLQKLYNEGKLKDKKDVWLALNPKADKINAEYDAELARELYKEMKAGKLVTDMTVAEQKVANTYITEELRKSVDAEIKALEGKPVEETTPTEEVKNNISKTKDAVNNTPIQPSKASGNKVLYTPRKIVELAYANDKDNNPDLGGSGQELSNIIRRGGYAIEELNVLLPGWQTMSLEETTVSNDQALLSELTTDLNDAVNNPDKVLAKYASLVNDIQDEFEKLGVIKQYLTNRRDELTTSNPDDDVFSIGLEESTGITQEEIDEVRKILPRFISIADIKTIAANLKVKGIPYGVFKNKVIYLNTFKGKPGTAYHEAFHAVFRTMLTDEQIGFYLNEASKEFLASGKNIQEEIDKLRDTVSDYVSKSDEELVTIVLEEFLADKFSDYAKDRNTKTSGNVLKRFFFKVYNFFKEMISSFRDEPTSILFSNILKGSFLNSNPVNNVYTNFSDTVFKLLPKKKSAVANGFFTASESRKIINSFAIQVYKAKTGKYSNIPEIYQEVDGRKEVKPTEELIEYFISKRVEELNTKGKAYARTTFETDKVAGSNLQTKIEEELYLYNPESVNSTGANAKQTLVSSIQDKLDIFDFKNKVDEKEESEAGGMEALEVKEKLGSQDAWLSGGHDALSKAIKQYVAFTTMTETDILTGEVREVAVDEVTLYNGLTRILADTAEEQMIPKIHYASENNPNVKAFYEQILKDLGVTFDENTNSITVPTNANAYNIFRAFITNFKKSRVAQLDILLDQNTGKLTWVNANTNSPAKVSLDLWANNLQNRLIYGKATGESLAKNCSNIYNLANTNVINTTKLNRTKLDDQVNKIKAEFDKLGIPLTKAYIRFSLLQRKAELKSVELNKTFFTEEQLGILDAYKDTAPIDFNIFGSRAVGEGFSLADIFKKDPQNVYRGKEADSSFKSMAENNAIFDESIGNFSFTNAEGQRVFEIINNSYVLSRISAYRNDAYWKNIESKNPITTTDVERRNIEFVKDNFLVKNHKELLKNLKLNILSGFRDTTVSKKGETKEGITFGSFDGRSYLLAGLSLFNNNGKSDTAKYIFRQNEASNTAYVVELPKIKVLSAEGRQIKDAFFDKQVEKEYNRILREKKLFDANEGKKYKGYNKTLKDRAFDFTEFQYLKDTMSADKKVSEEYYKLLVQSALDGVPYDKLDSSMKQSIKYGIDTYLAEGFKQYKASIQKYNVQFFLDKDLKTDENLNEFYINDYMMSISMNELLDGDYALSRKKDKADISKRNKSGMASGPDYGKGDHNSAVIKDINLYTTLDPIDGKLQRIAEENVLEKLDDNGKVLYNYTIIDGTEYKVKDYTSNDAMSYSSQYHLMMGALRLGRFDENTKRIYKNIIQFTKRNEKGEIVRNVNIGNGNQEYLTGSLSSPNSKKTIVFDGLNGQLLKMSELGLVRSTISYVEDKDVDQFTALTDRLSELVFADDFESPEYRSIVRQIADLYKPIPGMEYWHKLANEMDRKEVDHVATESASKGATLLPEDSQSDSFDLEKSKFKVSNSNKRLQVETPTGKKEIVFGSQILTIITSEQDDELEVTINGETKTVGELKKQYNEAIAGTRSEAFKKAIAVIKDLRGNALTPDSKHAGAIDKSGLDDIVKRALVNSGADEQTMQYFEGGYNYNMVQMLVKAEQVILSHFSKGGFAQKVNGDKVSLVSDAGLKVVVNKETGKVVSHHELVKNPQLYSGENYEVRRLNYNVKDADGNLYSECMLSQAILTRHGLKIGDTITPDMQEVLKMLGYRIPTGDKQSAMSLKVVSLLPDYYQGIGIFPSEIVHLSGADFDIDSEFIQMPYFWYKKSDPTTPIKFGTEKSSEDKFEAFKFYNVKYNKEFARVYQEELAKSVAYQKVLKDKNLERDYKSNFLTEVENEIYQEVSASFGLPLTKEEFAKNPVDTGALLNNKALDAMIPLLTNEGMTKIANNTTSTDVIAQLVKDMLATGLIKEQSVSKVPSEVRSAHDVNGKFDSNVKNSEGKNGIGIAANKIQQFAFLMSKMGEKVVKFNEEAFKFEIAEQVGGVYTNENSDKQRIADNLNILLNVFTDNAKDPMAAKLNIKFELLGGLTELIMQGMSFSNAVKFINIPVIQKYGQLLQVLNYAVKDNVENNFSRKSTITAAIAYIKNLDKPEKDRITTKTMETVTSLELSPEFKSISTAEIEALLKGIDFKADELGVGNTSDALQVQLQALSQFVKVSDQNNIMSNLNTFLKLNQGLDISFNDLNNNVHKAIDTFDLNSIFGVDKKDTDLSEKVKSHIDISDMLKDDVNTFNNIKRALVVESQVGKKIFIEQTDLFKKTLEKLLPSLNNGFTTISENYSKISKEFLGYISVRTYIENLELLKSKEPLNSQRSIDIQKRLKSIDLGLVFQELNGPDKDTLARQLDKLKANPATKDNYIVRYLTTALANDGSVKEGQEAQLENKSKNATDYIVTKSFVKESNETISELIDSVKSLYYNNEVIDEDTNLTPREFVNNMLSYLMVKDNMLFKNNSVSKFLPVEMFGNYSKLLDNLTNSLVTKENLNLDKFDQLAYNFRKLYVTDKNTNIAALKFKELVPDNKVITVNEDGSVDFKVSSTTRLELFIKNKQLQQALNRPESERSPKLEKELNAEIAELQEKLDSEDIGANIVVLEKIFDIQKLTKKEEIDAVSYVDKKSGEVKQIVQFKFPQFKKFKIKGVYKVYELKQVMSKLPTYGNGTLTDHNTNLGYAVGEQAVYAPLENVGYKNVSVYFPGTYEKAVEEFSKIKQPETTSAVDELLNTQTTKLSQVVTQPKIEVKPGVSELFESNPELANIGTPEQYSQYLDTIFPNSKVKDIVYHGSKIKFDKFDKSKLGQFTGAESAKQGFFFAGNYNTSLQYVIKLSIDIAQEQSKLLSQRDISVEDGLSLKDLQDQYDAVSNKATDELVNFLTSDKFPPDFTYNVDSLEKLKNAVKWSAEDIGADVNEYLSEFDTITKEIQSYVRSMVINITNPISYDFKQNENYQTRDISFDTLLKNKTNEDGAIFKNVYDPLLDNIYVVFEPEQIHILGGKQDIEGFKKFTTRTTTSTDIEAFERSSFEAQDRMSEAFERSMANEAAAEAFESNVTSVDPIIEQSSFLPDENTVFLQKKKNMINLVNSKTLSFEGKPFRPGQYQKLIENINKAKTPTELNDIENNIKKCL